MIVGGNAARNTTSRLVVFTVLAFKMQPIDSPGIFIVGPKSIRSILRKYDVFILSQNIFFAIDLIPSLTIRTIDKYGIVATVFLLDIMVFYPREISYLPQKQVSDQGIFTICLQQVVRERGKPFSLDRKSVV